MLEHSVDPEIRDVLRHIPRFVLSDDSLPTVREFAAVEPRIEADIERQELRAGPGGEISMTLLRPRDKTGDLPALFWMHGGGVLMGNRNVDGRTLNGWCRTLACVCVTVEYRLAPEATYPQPLDDCDIGLRCIFDHASELGVDPHRIGVGGRSAGRTGQGT
jgi:acetyl esterase/lipase